jgi:hypothetical protein
MLAACPLWKKVRQSASAAHLVRWFDHMAALPACAAAVEDLCPTKKREAAAAADTAAGKGGGGEKVWFVWFVCCVNALVVVFYA